MRLVLAIVVVFLFIAGAVAGSYALSVHALDQSQHQWCDTLNLLTVHPVAKPSDPAANPSRMESYEIYLDFVSLRDRFGC